MISEDIFAEVFRENVRRRSRSVGGVDGNTTSGSSKLPMLLSGDDLAAQVARNLEALIVDVLGTRVWEGDEPVGPTVRIMCERWFDIATEGLIDYDGYAKERERIIADLMLMNMNFGTAFRFSRRYRLWTPKYYTVMDIPPQLIDGFMDLFYREFGTRLDNLIMFRSQLEAACAETNRPMDESIGIDLMAFVNVMMDGIIHPWLDACSRVSTALLMWTALQLKEKPPLYVQDKKVHVSTITDVAKHEDYLREGLCRFDAWVAGR